MRCLSRRNLYRRPQWRRNPTKPTRAQTMPMSSVPARAATRSVTVSRATVCILHGRGSQACDAAGTTSPRDSRLDGGHSEAIDDHAFIHTTREPARGSVTPAFALTLVPRMLTPGFVTAPLAFTPLALTPRAALAPVVVVAIAIADGHGGGRSVHRLGGHDHTGHAETDGDVDMRRSRRRSRQHRHANSCTKHHLLHVCSLRMNARH